tara:strand:+ start:105 stop:206 length:102 start_codon:yes stop_codon:yes gene_type:complete
MTAILTPGFMAIPVLILFYNSIFADASIGKTSN